MVDYVIIQGSPEVEQKMEWIATDGKVEDGIGRGGRKGRRWNGSSRTERRKTELAAADGEAEDGIGCRRWREEIL